MIRLGDVNFDLGADTRGLRNSERALRNFGRTVDRVAGATATASTQIERDFRKQEKAATDALNKVLAMNQQMRKVKGTDTFINQNVRSFSQLNNVLTSGRLSALQYQRAMEQFKAATQNSTRSFRDYYVQAKAGQGANQGLIESFQNLSNGLVFIQGPLGGFATRVTSLVSILKRGGFEIAAFIGGIAAGSVTFYKFGSAILDAGKQANAFISQFAAVTGSQNLAAEAMNRITTIARLSGQRIEDLGQAYAKFMASAKGTGMSLKTIDEIFLNVAKAATTMNMSAEQSQGIFRALEQMMSKGTVQAEELRGQLGDRLAGAVQLAARALGLTTRKLQDLMKTGDIAATDLLPKLAKEIAKTLGFSSAPIDNYTAAVNNASTAWFQLRVKLDQSIGVTNKVMEIYKQLTKALDWARVNMDDLKLAIVGATGAFLAFVSPIILGGILKATKLVYDLTKGVNLLNIAILANPFGAFLKLALAIGGATAALYKFRNEIRPIQGELATLGDYMTVLWSDFRRDTKDTFDEVMATAKSFSTLMKDLFHFEITFDNGWIGVGNALIDFFVQLWREIEIVASAAISNIKADMKELATLINDTRRFFAPWLDDPEGGKQSDKGFEWFDKYFAGMEAQRKTWEDVQKEIAAINGEQLNIMDKVIKKWEDINDRANANALDRMGIGPPRRYRRPDKQEGFDAFTPEKELTDKQRRAADKLKEAWDSIDQAIENAREELEAMGTDEATLKSLRETFKREKEVEKYAKALRKAGADTDEVKRKTKELYDLLEKRDAWKKSLEAMGQLQDSLARGMDTAWDSIIDGILEGKNALQSLADVSKQIVADILKTWTKLAILNPIKNWLFGTDEPTLKGGFLGNIMKAVPGIWGNKSSSNSALGVPQIPQMPANDNFNLGSIIDFKRASQTVSPVGQLGGGSVAKQAWDFFTGKGLKPHQAAGILGHIKAESGFNPNAVGDNGKAFGLFQHWQNRGGGPGMLGDTQKQLNLAWKELQGSENLALQKLLKSQNVTEATKAFGQFERPQGYSANNPEAMHNFVGRLKGAEEALQKFGQSTQSNTTVAAEALTKLNTTVPTTVQNMQGLGKGFDQFGNALSTSAQTIQSSVQSASGGGGGLFGWLSKLFGGFNFSNLVPNSYFLNTPGLYANGGVFGSGGEIFNTPTLFQHGGGSGILGEDGDEAVMPLSRDGSGKLGVQAVIPKASGGNVIVNIILPEGTEATKEQKKDEKGNDVIDVIIAQTKQSIAGDISKGGSAINKAVEARYNLKSSSGLK